jgi:hypothetical protein
MKSFVRWALVTTVVVIALLGCATAPQITKGASNYLQKGVVSAKFKGNDFYMVIGEVDLYQYGVFGNLQPSGQTVEVAAVVQADKDTGEILKIATLQSSYSSGITVANGANYGLADLRGGISVIDSQPYPRWLDAIQSMRNAIVEMNTYTTFAGSDQSGLVVVAVSPRWFWWGPHRRWR